jgi:NAD(P)-dependent dehydrogenase (short-subunit alcohol dehydrogenase family)
MRERSRRPPPSFPAISSYARSLDDAARVADEVKRRFARLDFVFLNAGIGRMRPIEAIDEAEFDEHFDINVKGQFFTLQKILPLLSDNA